MDSHVRYPDYGHMSAIQIVCYFDQTLLSFGIQGFFLSPKLPKLSKN